MQTGGNWSPLCSATPKWRKRFARRRCRRQSPDRGHRRRHRQPEHCPGGEACAARLPRRDPHVRLRIGRKTGAGPEYRRCPQCFRRRGTNLRRLDPLPRRAPGHRAMQSPRSGISSHEGPRFSAARSGQRFLARYRLRVGETGRSKILCCGEGRSRFPLGRPGCRHMVASPCRRALQSVDRGEAVNPGLRGQRIALIRHP